MLTNNAERLTIVLAQATPFDYVEFRKACESSNITPLSIGDYAQKIGMLMVAMVTFPNVAPAVAYLRLVAEMNKDYEQGYEQGYEHRTAAPGGTAITTVSESPVEGQARRNCGGCGGGKVR